MLPSKSFLLSQDTPELPHDREARIKADIFIHLKQRLPVSTWQLQEGDSADRDVETPNPPDFHEYMQTVLLRLAELGGAEHQPRVYRKNLCRILSMWYALHPPKEYKTNLVKKLSPAAVGFLLSGSDNADIAALFSLICKQKERHWHHFQIQLLRSTAVSEYRNVRLGLIRAALMATHASIKYSPQDGLLRFPVWIANETAHLQNLISITLYESPKKSDSSASIHGASADDLGDNTPIRASYAYQPFWKGFIPFSGGNTVTILPETGLSVRISVADNAYNSHPIEIDYRLHLTLPKDAPSIYGPGDLVQIDITGAPVGTQLPPSYATFVTSKTVAVLHSRSLSSKRVETSVNYTSCMSGNRDSSFLSFRLPSGFDGEWVELTLCNAPPLLHLGYSKCKIALYTARTGDCLISRLPSELWKYCIIPRAFACDNEREKDHNHNRFNQFDWKRFCAVMSTNRRWHRILVEYAEDSIRTREIPSIRSTVKDPCVICAASHYSSWYFCPACSDVMRNRSGPSVLTVICPHCWSERKTSSIHRLVHYAHPHITIYHGK